MRRVLQGDVSELHEMSSPAMRAGVIPYAISNQSIYWLFGISQNENLCDFGGGHLM